MTASLVLPERFNGPPGSANGGYAAGRLAAYVGAADAVEVTLRRPPPLGRELAVRRAADSRALLLDGAEVVAEARAATLELRAVPAVSAAEARAATARPEDFPQHPFPTCFGCGPRRDPAEAVRILVGPVAGRAGVHAAAWTPPAALAGPGGRLPRELAWVALDCPSSVPVVPQGSAPHVLGRLTARVGAPLRAGEEHRVVAWPLGREGRKAYGASAVLDAAGEVRAIGRAVWIALQRPDSARQDSASASGTAHAR